MRTVVFFFSSSLCSAWVAIDCIFSFLEWIYRFHPRSGSFPRSIQGTVQGFKINKVVQFNRYLWDREIMGGQCKGSSPVNKVELMETEIFKGKVGRPTI